MSRLLPDVVYVWLLIVAASCCCWLLLPRLSADVQLPMYSSSYELLLLSLPTACAGAGAGGPFLPRPPRLPRLRRSLRACAGAGCGGSGGGGSGACACAHGAQGGAPTHTCWVACPGRPVVARSNRQRRRVEPWRATPRARGLGGRLVGSISRLSEGAPIGSSTMHISSWTLGGTWAGVFLCVVHVAAHDAP